MTAKQVSDNAPNRDADDFDDVDSDEIENKYLTFRLSGEDYAVELRYVTEIVVVQEITPVPDMPAFVKGIINMRGAVVPVMDVRARFHMEGRAYDDRTCIIVCNVRDVSIGLIVDTVKEVRDIPENAISPPPKVSRGAASQYVSGMGRVGEEVKIILDANKLLYQKELEALQAAM